MNRVNDFHISLEPEYINTYLIDSTDYDYGDVFMGLNSYELKPTLLSDLKTSVTVIDAQETPKLGANKRSIRFASKSLDTQKEQNPEDKLIKSITQKIINIIRNTSYEEGVLGLTEHELLAYFDSNPSIFNEVISRLWREFFKSSKDSDHAHFLNALINISEKLPQTKVDDFLPYAIAAIQHKSLLIKESGIAMFERWDRGEHRDYLNMISGTGVSWLDEYLNEVLASLGE